MLVLRVASSATTSGVGRMLGEREGHMCVPFTSFLLLFTKAFARSLTSRTLHMLTHRPTYPIILRSCEIRPSYERQEIKSVS